MSGESAWSSLVASGAFLIILKESAAQEAFSAASSVNGQPEQFPLHLVYHAFRQFLFAHG